MTEVSEKVDGIDTLRNKLNTSLQEKQSPIDDTRSKDIKKTVFSPKVKLYIVLGAVAVIAIYVYHKHYMPYCLRKVTESENINHKRLESEEPIFSENDYEIETDDPLFQKFK